MLDMRLFIGNIIPDYLLSGNNEGAWSILRAMKEIEVKILNIDLKEVAKRLKKIGAKRTMPPTLFKIWQFMHPDLGKRYHSLLRVRHEGKEVVLTVKQRRSTRGYKVEDEFEVHTNDDMKSARKFLEAMGFAVSKEQEKIRESYSLGKLKVDMDRYPKMAPYMEIEGPSKKEILSLVKKLGLDPKSMRGDTATAVIREAGLNPDKLIFIKNRRKKS
jgi:adenylate cyclase class 2